MPELPEVETIARGLHDLLVGKRCTGLHAGWKKLFEPSFAAVNRAVVGRLLTDVTRHGKYLFLEFGGLDDARKPSRLMLHLRMTGQLFTIADFQPDKHVHAQFSFGEQNIWWRDIRKFGRIALLKEGAKADPPANIGPDMLKIGFTEWLRRLSQRQAPLKNLLLNQQIASGIGNIYADEALYRAGIHPLTTPFSLQAEELKRLFQSIRHILRLAIRYQGTTFSDFVDFSGRPGNFRRRLQVYGRTNEACYRCGTPISRLKLAGRSAHFCPVCQSETTHP